DGSHYSATVRAIVPEENPKTRTRRVRFHLDLDPSTLALAVQQSVTLNIPAGASRQITSVHKDAIIRRGPGSIVYVIEDNVAKLRPVETGAAIGTRLEVLQGLVEGERVVIRGNERLLPDQAVLVAGEGS
ncbi:MAG: efflux RND transporter periplasmic adaptor subunit, partial [bacterium]